MKTCPNTSKSNVHVPLYTELIKDDDSWLVKMADDKLSSRQFTLDVLKCLETSVLCSLWNSKLSVLYTHIHHFECERYYKYRLGRHIAGNAHKNIISVYAVGGNSPLQLMLDQSSS